MIASMDLNVSPEPEEDEGFLPEPQSEGDIAAEEKLRYTDHERHIEESAVEILRREREERIQKIRRQRPDERQLFHQDFSHLGKRRRSDSRLPQGWLNCPSYGHEINLLIPSKVPLGEAYNADIPPGKRYSYKQVLHLQSVTRRKLGLVIDLTNSTRYYEASVWMKEGIKYVKIRCKGRDSVPENSAVNTFCYEVSQFIARQKPPKKYILVHCTHGHNRTGFMIVHYLMRTQAISVTQAIQTFAEARPPGIYKPDYIDALYHFYHEKKPEISVCPPTPEWKRTDVLDLNGDAVVDDEDEEGDDSNDVEHETQETQTVMTIDDLLGDPIPIEQQFLMRQFCYQSLKLPGGPRGASQFPGSHPVSLNRDNLQLLRQRYYYATWKADGTRFMMLITADGCYLIDRKFEFRRVQMRFPCRPNNDKGVPEKPPCHHYTLLDGEMVIDTMPDSKKQERRYLIYDMMALNQISIVERPFNERWKMIEKEVIEPRNSERQHIHQSSNSSYRYDLEPFRVRRKDFWLLSTVTKLLNGFIPKLSHEADGLIFQGWDDPYVPRTHEGLLKWKYAQLNTVDFLFEVVDGREFLYVFENKKKKLMEGTAVVFQDGVDPSTYSGKIIECYRDCKEEVWACLRVRTDKDTPNEFNTYLKVMQSIKDNITEEILLKEIGNIIQLPMYADRIHSDSKAAAAHHRR